MYAQLLERRTILGEPAGADDLHFPLVEMRQCRCKPGPTAFSVDHVRYLLIWQRLVADQKIHALGTFRIPRDRGCLQRSVVAGEACVHDLHVVETDAESSRDLLMDRLYCQLRITLGKLCPQPAEIEKQGLLRRAGTSAHDRP